MISCTEFIPFYSELFSWMEGRFGRAAIDRYWSTLFRPDGKGSPLIGFLEKEGLKGCLTYWTGTLSEEAADFTLYLNEKRGFFILDMHHCPSKGKLLELEQKIGLKPYPDYCLHCDNYRAAVEKAGLNYIYSFRGIEKASCSILITDPSRFDGRIIVDGDTRILDRRAADNEYFHPSFHFSLSRCLHYIGETYGEAALTEALRLSTEHIYPNELKAIREGGLPALADAIRASYRREKQEDILKLEQKEGSLYGETAYCPGVRAMRSAGKWVSPWYSFASSAVLGRLAEEIGLTFCWDAYNEESGASRFRIS